MRVCTVDPHSKLLVCRSVYVAGASDPKLLVSRHHLYVWRLGIADTNDRAHHNTIRQVNENILFGPYGRRSRRPVPSALRTQ